MKCGYCGSDNPTEDMRCHLCGRRLSVSGPMLVPESHGSAAPKLEILEDRLAVEDRRSRHPVQARLFPVQEAKRVIPFESISAETAKSVRTTQERNAKTRSKQRYNERLGLGEDGIPEAGQKEFPFPETHVEMRRVEPVVYTNAPVAMPAHRAMAAAYDSAMILIGVGILIGIYYLAGGHFGLAKFDLGTYAGAVVGVTLLYKVLWAIGDGDSPGMNAVHLRLLNFDGRRPTREERLMRLLVSIVSFCSLGVGLAWCLFDEEKLTWHDHITKTFPSPKREEDGY